MKVQVINKSNHNLPKYETSGSAGFDIKANTSEPIALASLERVIIPTGLFMAIPDGYELQIRPRSGMAAKYGITVLNSPGTIDSDYRKEIGVILINLSNEKYIINPGDRIAQGIINKIEQIEWDEVNELNETGRKDGFGSTGK